MLSPKNLQALMMATNLAWFSGAVPYRFQKQSKGDPVLVIATTRKRRIFVKTAFLVNLLYVVFIVLRVLQKTVMQKGTAPSLTFLVTMGYLFSAYMLPVVLQRNTLQMWEETPRFIMRFIIFFKHVQAKYVAPNAISTKRIKFFTAVFVIGMAINIQNVAIILRKPYQPHLLTSLLPDPKNASFIVRLPLLLYHIWVWAGTWTNIWMFIFQNYLYITCGIFLVRELDILVKKPRTNIRLRDPQTGTRILRSMQVLHRIWQINYQEWFCPTHKLCVISIATLASYGVIKLTGPRSFVMGFVALLSIMYLSTLFYKFGKFNEMSAKTLRNWYNSPSTTKLTRKFIASVPVFSIGIGHFYNVKRTTVIMVLWTVLNNTITLFFL